ncbi:MAG: V-type ATP synthase subunit D [Verrucomicrobiota bacterium]
MSKPVLSKNGLQHERENLRLYRKVLPSLDLKRRQLLGEQKRAEHAARQQEESFAAFNQTAVQQLPMLGARAVPLEGLLQIREIKVGVENVVGVKLPILETLTFDTAPYSFLAKPHWVDLALQKLREYAELKARIDIAHERVQIIRQAARKITQRVNLFEKILIPTAEKNIKRIQIYLADAERAAVVQSKIAKSKGRQLRRIPDDQPEPEPLLP